VNLSDGNATWVNRLDPVPEAFLARGILGVHLALFLAALRDVWAHFGVWEQSTVQIGVQPARRVAWISSPGENEDGTLEEPVVGEWQLSLSELLSPGYVEHFLQEAFDEMAGGFGLVIPPVVKGGAVLLKRIMAEGESTWFQVRSIRAL